MKKSLREILKKELDFDGQGTVWTDVQNTATWSPWVETQEEAGKSEKRRMRAKYLLTPNNAHEHSSSPRKLLIYTHTFSDNLPNNISWDDKYSLTSLLIIDK